MAGAATPACRSSAGTGRAYAEGAREGAPDAIQVADRFQLWQNLCDAVEKTVIAVRLTCENLPLKLQIHRPPKQPPHPRRTSRPAASPEPGAGRLAVRAREGHAAVQDLLARGRTHTQIRAMLGLSPKTVRKFIHAATPGQVTAGTPATR